MKYIKYFFQFILINLFFLIFRLVGYKNASNLGGIIGSKIGPIFKSKKIIKNNLKNYLPDSNDQQIKNIINKMWENYGRIFAEYMFIKDFRSTKLEKNLKINGVEYLDEIKKNQKPVIFVSGHFNNFELMAMQIEKSGINLAAIYRPLNNIFLNLIMERLRIKYICKKQIKKGRSGTRDLLESFKKNYSIALMIDQRVSEGEKINFFGKPALTTTLPAQPSTKYDLGIIPVYIERDKNNRFKIEFQNEINPKSFEDKLELTKELNRVLEKMITRNPNQWIWTHNRWK